MSFTPPPAHGTGAPSDWLLRWPQAWRDRPGATALDLACGGGRHLKLLAQAGLRVTGVDRDTQALAGLAGLGELIATDIESGPWPLEGRQFDLVVVTNYLWRPLLSRIEALVAPGGWLLYETFTAGQETIGRPSRPEFLLRSGELLTAFPALRIVGFEDGFLGGDGAAAPSASAPGAPVNGRHVQRVAAVRPAPAAVDGLGVYPRYRLDRP